MTIRDEEHGETEIVVEGSENVANQRRFPAPFYDHITGKLMKDPYVDVDGQSVDKSTIKGDVSEYFPNRALKSIIESEVALKANTWKGSVRRFDKALQSQWNLLVENSAFGTGEYRPLPDSYYCPITCDLITDPVISKYGTTYERGAIENWIRVNKSSPITREPLALSDLRENDALYDLIQHEKDRNLESMHPSIRRWKESGDPTSRRLPQRQQPQPSAPPAEFDEQEIAVSPAVVVPPGENYPTTEEEIEARRRQNRDTRRCVIVTVFTLLVFMFAFPYAFGVLLGILMMASPVICCCCVVWCCCGEEEEGESE
eukprot:scaffold513_cov169-Amphora_coffeaeformis.AAC.5